MPLIAIDVVEGLRTEQHHALIREVSAVVAAILDSPVDRLRVRINALPLDQWGVGGVPAAELAPGPAGSGPVLPAVEQAPMIGIELLQGRPAEQHDALIEQVSTVVATIVGCPLNRVRIRINEVAPGLWGIGGVPAARQRADEVQRRREAAERAS